ncbi:SCO2322 family protein [Streptomyces sp. 8N706]|uniref:SCO2322 family protein n=1 Tax=Streptomyces sp. 8N706 TaxID=3457416 RepID=UPI003FD3265A
MSRAVSRAASKAVAVAAGAAAMVVTLGAGPAHGQGYRYWSFWDRDGGRWIYSTQGPAMVRPSDGAVQGFRFAISEDSADAAQPRGAAGFDAICSRTPAAEPGSKRVALVLDFGTPADAPSGETPPGRRTECVSVPEDATSAEALAAVAKPLRYGSDALLCAIAGYPETGCGEQVSGDASSKGNNSSEGNDSSKGGTSSKAGASAQPNPGPGAADSGDGGPATGLFAGLAAVLALGAAAVWQSRRRRG